MKEETIAVILCTQDEADGRRMAEMIGTLEIPKIHGRLAKVEVVCAIGRNMAEACNAGMQQSKARYKCYITSEVTVLAAELLMLFLKIFENHPRTGMVGCYGSSLPMDGDYRRARHRYGCLCWRAADGSVFDDRGDPGLGMQRVHAIDGAIVMTCVDVPWDTRVDEAYRATAHAVRLRAAHYETRVPCAGDQERYLALRHPSPYAWTADDAAFERARQSFVARYANELYPLVSILIPAYNQPRFCREALESALAQDYPNIEILIGDDSTDDRVKTALAPLLAAHPNVRYQYRGDLPGEDAGANIRDLLGACHGDYVNLLYHDDLLYPQKIMRMMAEFLEDDEEQLAFVTSRRDYIDAEGNPILDINRYHRAEDRTFSGFELCSQMVLEQANIVGEMTTVLLRRSLLQQGGAYDIGIFFGYKEHSMGDISTWLELLRDGHTCVFLGERLSAFRKHAAQNSYNAATVLACTLDWLNFLVLAYVHRIYVRTEEAFAIGCESWRRQTERDWQPRMMGKLPASTLPDQALLEKAFQAVAAKDYDEVIALAIRCMVAKGADPQRILGGTPYANVR